MVDQHFPVCCYCGEPFDATDHRPLLLPCGHCLCKTCLTNQEDRDRQVCVAIGCNVDWSSDSLDRLQTVYNLIPPDSNNSTDSQGAGGRQVMPVQSTSAAATGREVMPAQNAAQPLVPFPRCDICESDFNGTDHRPLLLPCGHTYCRWCLNRLMSINRVCPHCRQCWQHVGLDSLPQVKNMVHPDNFNKVNKEKFKLDSALTERMNQLHHRGASNEDKDPEMELYIKGVDGKTATLTARKSDTVAAVFKKLRVRLGPCVDQQRLTYGGRTLEQNRTLSEYRVVAFSTLHLTCRMAGGAK